MAPTAAPPVDWRDLRAVMDSVARGRNCAVAAGSREVRNTLAQLTITEIRPGLRSAGSAAADSGEPESLRNSGGYRRSAMAGERRWDLRRGAVATVIGVMCLVGAGTYLLRRDGLGRSRHS